jgi:hypothetical protein
MRSTPDSNIGSSCHREARGRQWAAAFESARKKPGWWFIRKKVLMKFF